MCLDLPECHAGKMLQRLDKALHVDSQASMPSSGPSGPFGCGGFRQQQLPPCWPGATVVLARPPVELCEAS
jgi:hypothetical protein